MKDQQRTSCGCYEDVAIFLSSEGLTEDAIKENWGAAIDFMKSYL